ncbi:MAG: hypothetical protein MO852_03195 [Candidatus Devosia euplotis]|nr:hypothetical protein [Candidatus Devosia euplotis]
MLDIAAFGLDRDGAEILQYSGHQVGTCIHDPDLGIALQFDGLSATRQAGATIGARLEIAVAWNDIAPLDGPPGTLDLLGDIPAHPIDLPVIGKSGCSKQQHE